MNSVLINKIDTLYTKIISPNIDDYDGSQNKAEFHDCIEYINQCICKIDKKNIWFLEIGAYKGLWALAFNILCNENQKIPNYVTVTWMSQDIHNQDLYKTKEYYREGGYFFELINSDSTQLQSLQRVLEISPSYDFVFIDGDHSFHSVMKDINNYQFLASNLLIFHDINTKNCGVIKAIQKSGIYLNIRISYGDIMGIGIHNCKIPSPKRRKKILDLF